MSALLTDVDLADAHGQYKFNFRHSAISRDDSRLSWIGAFLHDFERNGPSLSHVQTILQGRQRYKDYPDASVRERFTPQMKKLVAPTMRRSG